MSPVSAVPLERIVRERALELGFHAVGFARAEPLDDDVGRLRDWLDRGLHAGMRFMERFVDVRRDPRSAGMLEGARTVISLALAYPNAEPARGAAEAIARHARGPDYHVVVRRLRGELPATLRGASPSVRGRAVVDSAPLLERAWAVRAGLGWVGRNACLVTPGAGSWVVLGELVVTAELEPSTPVADACGECRACVEACPSGALARPDGRVLDARRCLSYWTVEADEDLPADLGGAAPLFGCDACQLACPRNRAAAPATTLLAPLPRWNEIGLEELATADEAQVEQWVHGTALERAGAERIRLRARQLLARCARAPRAGT